MLVSYTVFMASLELKESICRMPPSANLPDLVCIYKCSCMAINDSLASSAATVRANVRSRNH